MFRIQLHDVLRVSNGNEFVAFSVASCGMQPPRYQIALECTDANHLALGTHTLCVSIAEPPPTLATCVLADEANANETESVQWTAVGSAEHPLELSVWRIDSASVHLVDARARTMDSGCQQSTTAYEILEFHIVCAGAPAMSAQAWNDKVAVALSDELVGSVRLERTALTPLADGTVRQTICAGTQAPHALSGNIAVTVDGVHVRNSPFAVAFNAPADLSWMARANELTHVAGTRLAVAALSAPGAAFDATRAIENVRGSLCHPEHVEKI